MKEISELGNHQFSSSNKNGKIRASEVLLDTTFYHNTLKSLLAFGAPRENLPLLLAGGVVFMRELPKQP